MEPGTSMRPSRLKTHLKLLYRRLVGAKLYEKLEFKRHLGYWPDLNNPETFNERLCARKFAAIPLAPLLADKIAVRDFVADRVGQEVLTQLYYAGDRPDLVDYDSLPERFVVKGAHGSGPELRALIWNKSSLSRARFVRLGKRILKRRCGPEVNEWWYTQIPSRLLVEEMLVESDGTIPPDYKCYVFNGLTRFIQVVDGRHDVPRARFYDRQWAPQPFTREGFREGPEIACPRELDDLLFVAEKLGSDLEFVRVDLYVVNGRIFFGEITLAPGAGWIAFQPRAYDRILGRYWPNRP
jgi:hypothetical protein